MRNLIQELAAARAEVAHLEQQLERERAEQCRAARIVIGSGRERHVFPLGSNPAESRAIAADINRALFPSPGKLHKARRRGERALAECRA